MLINWREIAWKIYEDIKKQVETMSIKPCLWAILVWDNFSSLRYIKQKQKWAEYVWIDFVLKKLPDSITQEELLEEIENFNSDKKISAYIVQLPLPKAIDEKKIINSIDPKKDADWFHPENQWKIMIWDDSWFIPCTPSGIMHILSWVVDTLSWKQVVVIWRSNIVWKPITNLLINSGATVISCNSKTPDIKKYTLDADIVISAAGSPWLIKADMLDKSSIVIDVWFTVIDEKIYWDADTSSIDKAWIKITPVPWWVWALTVAMLMKNTLKASKLV